MKKMTVHSLLIFSFLVLAACGDDALPEENLPEDMPNPAEDEPEEVEVEVTDGEE